MKTTVVPAISTAWATPWWTCISSAIPELYDFCESNDIHYVIGLITNDRLRNRVADLLKLLKIGARVRQTARKVWFHLASGYPYQDLLAQILENIRTAPT